jgi:hypothetical protein
LLDSDYFADDAANTPKEFWCHFQTNKELLKIVFGVQEYDDYFMCKKDCTSFLKKKDCIGLWGFSLVQKCMAALRYIAYGAPCDTNEALCDTNEDYLRMAESTCFETMGRFLPGSCGSVWKRLFVSPK